MSYKNIVATIGQYERDGKTKYVSRTVGKLVETQYGPKIKLDASFSPAGCVKGDDGTVWLALFDPKPRDTGSFAEKSHPEQQQDGNFDDDIPF